MVKSYIFKHTENNNDLFLTKLLKKSFREKSLSLRHRSTKTYRTYVLYNINEHRRKAIKGWCCNCKMGHRTVECDVE